jgi:ABC-type molybdate transport system substrate-binding protein
MKKHIIILLLAVFTVFLSTSCGHLLKMQNPQKYSVRLENSRPLNIGKVQTTKHGAYHVQIYDRSVIFMAMTKVITPGNVEVFDLDHNGTFDAVFVYQGSWSFGATQDFREKYSTLYSTLNQATVNEWIETAAVLKKSKSAKASPTPLTVKQPTSWRPPSPYQATPTWEPAH